MLENVGGVIQNCISLGALALVLVPYGVWLPFALLIGALPALYVAVQHNIRQHRWRVATTADERRAWYYYWLLTAREAAAEIRLFGLGERFRGAYDHVRTRLRTERINLAKDQGLAETLAGTVGLAVMGIAMAVVAWQGLTGATELTLGDLALFYQAFIQGQAVMRALVGALSQIFANSLFLGNLYEFLELSPEIGEPDDPVPPPDAVREGISFSDVSFSYPDSDRPALSDFALRIPAGRITAIVGPNGAGKSTLIKLICRLYDPDSGSISIDGHDLRSFETMELRRSITVLFQEPVNFNASVAENIALGELSADNDEEAITQAARASGADEVVARLSDGYETLLGKLFAGGTDLSVGEWQRIALARAFLRQAPIIILDEPTSAMDPWAEAEWLGRFRDLAAGRTSLIITHRFTTAMHADEIHVVDEGRVVESGSHDQLIAHNGRYAESWTAQMRKVRVDG
jgi:ATP-binding cassette subfamily B protein